MTAKTYTIMEESADEHDNEPLNKQQYQPAVTEQIGSIISIDDAHMESSINEESVAAIVALE